MLSVVFFSIFAGVILASAQVTFRQVTVQSGDTSSASVVPGDFNNDGILDLITVNSSRTFGSPIAAPSWGGSRDLPIIRDLDLDGRHDLAMAWTDWFNGDGGVEALRNTNATVKLHASQSERAQRAHLRTDERAGGG